MHRIAHTHTNIQCALKERVRDIPPWWPRHIDLMAKIFRELWPPERRAPVDTYMSALCYISAQYRAPRVCVCVAVAECECVSNIRIHRQTPPQPQRCTTVHIIHTHPVMFAPCRGVRVCAPVCVSSIHRVCLLRVHVVPWTATAS